MPAAKREPAVTPVFGSDPPATAHRIEQLQTYMDANVLSPTGFCCASQEACRASLGPGVEMAEGQLSHVGHHYDLTRFGKLMRIMVVGMEYSDGRPNISLQARYGQIHDVCGLELSYYRSAGHKARNPHIRGTTSALRLILGKGLGSEWEDEFIETGEGDRFHIFDAFALVNVLLCGAHRPGSTNGCSTKIMRRNCRKHFAATLSILEPTLLVLQGEGVQDWIAPVLGMMEEITPHLARASLQGVDPLVCSFSHPSARGNLRWGDRLDASYLLEVVEPTIRRAVSLESEGEARV